MITPAEVDEAVLEMCDSSFHEDAWGEFYFRLLSNEAVSTPLGYAQLQDQCNVEAATDSYGEAYGDYDIWFIFSIAGEDGLQYFKKAGYQSSYSGRCFDARTVEVEMGQVMRIEWKEK